MHVNKGNAHGTQRERTNEVNFAEALLLTKQKVSPPSSLKNLALSPYAPVTVLVTSRFRKFRPSTLI